MQLQDVARALAFVQEKAASWGGDPDRVILMGHSAGAHLVTLLDVSPFSQFNPRPRPVLGTVSLDSAAMDVEQVMTPGSAPVLSVYSTRRDDATRQTQQFAAKGKSLGLRIETLGQDLSHGDINGQLGLDNAYTRQVETFMASLDAKVAQLLR
ncbi:MAG: hypothetical protein RLZZ11_1885 [Cyanobacteriota bacterium]